MTGRILLQGGRVINPSTNHDGVADVLIEDGRVAAIGQNLSADSVDHVVRLTAEQWVIPGLVDIHVHFRDPGFPDKETTRSGAEAAIAGGVTTVCTMPNTRPVVDNVQTLQHVQRIAREQSRVHIHPVAAITKDLAGEELVNYGKLYENGAVGFTDDGHCVNNADRMRRCLELTRIFNAPVMVHAEDCHLAGKGCMHEGEYSTRMGLPGQPSVAESTIVARDIELARMTGGHVHFTHISSKESIALIRRAKAEGLPVTVDVTPHHLALNDEDVANAAYDPDFKMNPPLRSEADRQALIQALKEGVIDAIATDHAPHNLDEKQLPFDVAPCGVVGIETSLAVILTYFVHPGEISPMDLVRRMSYQPAQVMRLPFAGRLEQGLPADITVVEPNIEWFVTPEVFQSKSKNSPFKGMTLRGKAKMVFVDGQCVLGEHWLSQAAATAV
jgi:dihydroorotase